VLKHNFVTVLLAVAAIAYEPQCVAAGKDWYPKATDTCAEFATKMLAPPTTGGKLVTTTKDPAIAKYVSEFNAATGSNDKGGLAMLALLGYCGAHAFVKLGDVTAQAVFAEVQASTAESNANPQNSQPASSAPSQTAELDAWYKQARDFCGADYGCNSVAKKYYDDALACIGGDSVSCGNKERNLSELNRWNSGHRSAQAQAPQNSPQDPMMKCLQDVATQTMDYCRRNGCPDAQILSIVGKGQQMRCGYTAIQSTTPAGPATILTGCSTVANGKGNWITTCTQF
jgi:hypothetical protein